jgi:hypothetical protein
MRDVDATVKAGDFIKLILQHQPELFGSAPLLDTNSAKRMAHAIASLRAELVELLKPQL